MIFYRAHWMSGNTAFVDDLVVALEEAGTNALPVYCYSLRAGADGRVTALELLKDRVDCLVTTVLAGGGSNAADAHRSGSPEEWLEWEVPALEELGVPVLQGICTTSTREAWLASDAGLSPLDTAWQVAIPEFDGRIIGVPFSFKERLGDGSPVGAPLTLYRADPERTARLAGLAARFADLGRLANAGEEGRHLALQLPDQTLAGGQRRRAGYPRERHRAARRHARGRLRGWTTRPMMATISSTRSSPPGATTWSS